MCDEMKTRAMFEMKGEELRGLFTRKLDSIHAGLAKLESLTETNAVFAATVTRLRRDAAEVAFLRDHVRAETHEMTAGQVSTIRRDMEPVVVDVDALRAEAQANAQYAKSNLTEGRLMSAGLADVCGPIYRGW